MGQVSRQTAVYDGVTGIRIGLQRSIGPERFLANTTDYRGQLAKREDMPAGLKHLIAQLFEGGAITECSIMYGKRVDFKIATHDQAGHLLLAGRRLEHFLAAFGKITGQPVVAAWHASGEQSRQGSAGGVDGETFLGFLARLVDSVANGIEFAAAIKILTDD